MMVEDTLVENSDIVDPHELGVCVKLAVKPGLKEKLTILWLLYFRVKAITIPLH